MRKPKASMQNTRAGWDKRLHIERPGAVKLCCPVCSEPFWIPPSKIGQRRSCWKAECVVSAPLLGPESRKRKCETCATIFSPRPAQIRSGQGRFCSQKCNTAGRKAMTSEEAILKRTATRRENVASGKTVYPTGEANKQWLGGPKACVQRRRHDGREAAGLRAYRKANPDKVREFRQTRSTNKAGAKLPRGTVPAIRKAQGNKCAICRVSLRGGSHLDHIVPLARGGKHEGRNLQLLCPPCNLKKSDRDPVDHMRSLGRLI